jgi:hypothetical protein
MLLIKHPFRRLLQIEGPKTVITITQ